MPIRPVEKEIANTRNDGTLLKPTRTQSLKLAPLFVTGVALGMELRLFHVISKRAVNVLFGDQWNFMSSFFEHQPLWRLYVQQYGPHREGLGFVLDKLLFDSSSSPSCPRPWAQRCG